MIILYTQEGCLKCEALKTLLDKHNIKYTINKSIEEMLSLGFDRTPVLRVDDKCMYSDEAERWIINNTKEN